MALDKCPQPIPTRADVGKGAGYGSPDSMLPKPGQTSQLGLVEAMQSCSASPFNIYPTRPKPLTP